MAILNAPKDRGPDLGELAPKGTHIATCFEITDEFGVERTKYQSDEIVKQNVTRFYFGFKAKDGKVYKVRSKEMKISGDQKSALFGFLKSWLGHAPKYGWDYAEMKGKAGLITVDHSESKGKTYANIVSITPLMEGLEEKVLPLSAIVATKAAAPAAPQEDDSAPF